MLQINNLSNEEKAIVKSLMDNQSLTEVYSNTGDALVNLEVSQLDDFECLFMEDSSREISRMNEVVAKYFSSANTYSEKYKHVDAAVNLEILLDSAFETDQKQTQKTTPHGVIFPKYVMDGLVHTDVGESDSQTFVIDKEKERFFLEKVKRDKIKNPELDDLDFSKKIAKLVLSKVQLAYTNWLPEFDKKDPRIIELNSQMKDAGDEEKILLLQKKKEIITDAMTSSFGKCIAHRAELDTNAILFQLFAQTAGINSRIEQLNIDEGNVVKSVAGNIVLYGGKEYEIYVPIGISRDQETSLQVVDGNAKRILRERSMELEGDEAYSADVSITPKKASNGNEDGVSHSEFETRNEISEPSDKDLLELSADSVQESVPSEVKQTYIAQEKQDVQVSQDTNYTAVNASEEKDQGDLLKKLRKFVDNMSLGLKLTEPEEPFVDSDRVQAENVDFEDTVSEETIKIVPVEPKIVEDLPSEESTIPAGIKYQSAMQVGHGRSMNLQYSLFEFIDNNPEWLYDAHGKGIIIMPNCVDVKYGHLNTDPKTLATVVKALELALDPEKIIIALDPVLPQEEISKLEALSEKKKLKRVNKIASELGYSMALDNGRTEFGTLSAFEARDSDSGFYLRNTDPFTLVSLSQPKVHSDVFYSGACTNMLYLMPMQQRSELMKKLIVSAVETSQRSENRSFDVDRIEELNELFGKHSKVSPENYSNAMNNIEHFVNEYVQKGGRSLHIMDGSEFSRSINPSDSLALDMVAVAGNPLSADKAVLDRMSLDVGNVDYLRNLISNYNVF